MPLVLCKVYQFNALQSQPNAALLFYAQLSSIEIFIIEEIMSFFTQ